MNLSKFGSVVGRISVTQAVVAPGQQTYHVGVTVLADHCAWVTSVGIANFMAVEKPIATRQKHEIYSVPKGRKE